MGLGLIPSGVVIIRFGKSCAGVDISTHSKARGVRDKPDRSPGKTNNSGGKFFNRLMSVAEYSIGAVIQALIKLPG